MSRPPAASPGRERIVNQISDLDHPGKGNNAMLREYAGNNKDQGDKPQARHARAIADKWRDGTTIPCSRAVPAPALPDGWARERRASRKSEKTTFPASETAQKPLKDVSAAIWAVS